jgi:tRNA(adenine34) deaminase
MDEKYIERCIELSREALRAGDNPFGSVIVRNDQIVCEARNKIKENDVTQHAEIVAMKEAQKILESDDLSECVIYSNCEPCPMYSFMIRELKFKKVVFALESPYMGGFSRWDILQDRGLLRFKPVFGEPPEVVKGILKEQAHQVFQEAGWTVDQGLTE